MKAKTIALFFCFFSWDVIACDDFKLQSSLKSNGYELIDAFKSERFKEGSSIYFYNSITDEHPDINASFMPDRCFSDKNFIFDVFSFDGSVANVESVFWGKGKFKSNLFIIVSWIYNLDGINTVGKYYSVYAYDFIDGKVKKNELITSYFDEGQDGLVDGKTVKYAFKNASDVWEYLKRK